MTTTARTTSGRLVLLHLRSRRSTAAAALLVAVAVSLRASRTWVNGGLLGQVLTMIMLTAVASVVATSTHNPFGEIEKTAPTPTVALRLLHLGCLIVVAGGLTVLAEPTNTPYAGPGYAIRDLAGFIGLALLGTAALGPTFSWALPLAYTVACGNALDAGLTAGWTWPTRAAGDRTGILAATALLVVGIAISVTARFTRDGRDT